MDKITSTLIVKNVLANGIVDSAGLVNGETMILMPISQKRKAEDEVKVPFLCLFIVCSVLHWVPLIAGSITTSTRLQGAIFSLRKEHF